MLGKSPKLTVSIVGGVKDKTIIPSQIPISPWSRYRIFVTLMELVLNCPYFPFLSKFVVLFFINLISTMNWNDPQQQRREEAEDAANWLWREMTRMARMPNARDGRSHYPEMREAIAKLFADYQRPIIIITLHSVLLS